MSPVTIKRIASPSPRSQREKPATEAQTKNITVPVYAGLSTSKV